MIRVNGYISAQGYRRVINIVFDILSDNPVLVVGAAVPVGFNIDVRPGVALAVVVPV